MEEFLIIILVSLIATNLLGKAESVQLEETPLKIIDEIFGEGWWDNDKAEEWHKLTLELEQIESNSTDQNPPLTESDHSDNAKNGEEQSERMNEITSNEKHKIVAKFHAIKDELKQKGKFPRKERTQIEQKIAKHLKVNRTKIYKWKKEFGINRKVFHGKNERGMIEKFDQMKAELMRAGFKNSCKHEIDKTVAKELGLSFITIYKWKQKLGQTAPNNKYSDSEQKELMKRYYKIKDKTPKIKDVDIAKMLNIGRSTLFRWKSNLNESICQWTLLNEGQ